MIRPDALAPDAWVLAVDFGTTNTVAAIGDVRGVRPLTIDGQRLIPSAVLFREDGGWLVAKQAIDGSSIHGLAWFEASPKSWIPYGTVYLGGLSIPVVEAIAAVFRYVTNEAQKRCGSRRPARFVVTHPAGWAHNRIEMLLEAARKATDRAWPDPEPLAEPVAAAQLVIGIPEMSPEARIVVLEIGSGAIGVATVDRNGSQLAVAGIPDGIDAVGGEEFDVRLARSMTAVAGADGFYDKLCVSDNPSNRKLALEVRVLARSVKEQLSVDMLVPIEVPVPSPAGLEYRPVQISRSHLEMLIQGGDDRRPGLTEAVRLVTSALRQAPSGPPFAGVLLVGGSSRIPLLRRLLRSDFGRSPIDSGDPVTAVARGAATFALSAPSPKTTEGRIETPPAGIFISYRRQDDPGFAGRLYDCLREQFGEDHVFMDVDSVELGLDFVEILDRTLSRCRVLLAIIGPRWIAAVNEHGESRLNDPDDLVRLEIERALGRPDVRVIPILVDTTPMPNQVQLPRSLLPLRRRNACLISNARFRSDGVELIATIERIMSAAGDSSC